MPPAEPRSLCGIQVADVLGLDISSSRLHRSNSICKAGRVLRHPYRVLNQGPM